MREAEEDSKYKWARTGEDDKYKQIESVEEDHTYKSLLMTLY